MNEFSRLVADTASLDWPSLIKYLPPNLVPVAGIVIALGIIIPWLWPKLLKLRSDTAQNERDIKVADIKALDGSYVQQIEQLKRQILERDKRIDVLEKEAAGQLREAKKKLVEMDLERKEWKENAVAAQERSDRLQEMYDHLVSGVYGLGHPDPKAETDEWPTTQRNHDEPPSEKPTIPPSK